MSKVKELPTPSVIAKGIEKYISMSFGNLKFKDSLLFLNGSLESLVKYRKEKGSDQFKNLRAYFNNEWSHLPESAFNLLTRKGVYPYSYMDSFERFQEENLPPKEVFYNDLTNENISTGDYKHVQDIFNVFELKTLGDLHDLYMKTDILLLADVFEGFRDTIINNYELDPAHYITAPSLSWDAALKYTGIELEIPTDNDMHLFFDRAARGGVSYVGEQYARANHETMEGYDAESINSYIKLFDANNEVIINFMKYILFKCIAVWMGYETAPSYRKF